MMESFSKLKQLNKSRNRLQQKLEPKNWIKFLDKRSNKWKIRLITQLNLFLQSCST
jgi:hypothetical protein